MPVPKFAESSNDSRDARRMSSLLEASQALSGTLNLKAGMSRVLDGFIRVYSGCPGKGYAEGRYRQTVSGKSKKTPAGSIGGPPWPNDNPNLPPDIPEKPKPTNPPNNTGPRVNGPGRVR